MGFQKPARVEDVEREPYVCDVAAETRDAIFEVILGSIARPPRPGPKTNIGPSTAGNPCDYCLGCEIAGLHKDEDPDEMWLTEVGKAVHAHLESMFRRAGYPWLPESRNLLVGEIDGLTVRGIADLVHMFYGCVVDFKIVGGKTMTRVRKEGISPLYRKQAHAYGRAFADKGLKVNHVAVLFLTRERRSLRKTSLWWAEPYDSAVVDEVLERADGIASQIHTFGAEEIIPGLAKLPGCYDCNRWELPWA